MSSPLRARKDAKQVMKFIARNIMGAEEALGGAQGEETRQVAQGLLDSYREAGKRLPDRAHESRLPDQATAYVSGYQTAQLVVAGYAAVVYAGTGQPDERAGSLRRAAPRYLAATRERLPRVTTRSVGQTHYVTVGGRQQSSADSLDGLLVLHDHACCQLPAELTRIPLEAELAWFRWLAWKQGLLPLRFQLASHVWFGVATGIQEIPSPIRQSLVERRGARGWTWGSNPPA